MAEYAIGRRAPYVMVPRALIEDPNTDAHTLAAYIAIAYFSDFGQDSGAFPSDERAASLASMSRRTFIDRRQKLQEMGWLDWESGKEDGTTNRYTVHQDVPPHTSADDGAGGGVQEMHTGCAADAQGGVQEMHTTKSQDTKNQLPEDVFDRIWSYWEDRRALALGLSNGKRRPMEKTQKRLSKVRKIWGLGYSEPDFRRAIDGCTMSDFHIENGHLDIELICRDQQHFEQFLFRASQHRSSGNGRTPDADTTRDYVLKLYG